MSMISMERKRGTYFCPNCGIHKEKLQNMGYRMNTSQAKTTQPCFQTFGTSIQVQIPADLLSRPTFPVFYAGK